MRKSVIVYVIAILAALLPWILPIETLSVAGKINLSIFLLAGIFWILEPIPIYATSVVVILLQVIFLSAEGPMVKWSEVPLTEIRMSAHGEWQVPSSAVANGEVFIKSGNQWKKISVDAAAAANDGFVTIASPQLESGTLIAANANHWLLEFSAPGYAVYFGTLASPIIILFLGGFVLAAAAVKFQLDRNLSRIILKPFGTRPSAILLGLMLVTALLSGFMSNTATTAMMMAVILPIAASAPEGDRFRIALALSIPFAANIGGILTPIGTPPNAIAINALVSRDIAMPFSNWMLYTIPLVVIMLTVLWLILIRLYPSTQSHLPLNLTGRFLLNRHAIILYAVFGFTIVLWITESVHNIPSGMVAFIPVALLPAFGVIERKDIRSLPWEVLWLMAGGIALGVAMSRTGLASWMVSLVPWDAMGPLAILAAFGAVAILLATFIANTVAATLLIPIMMSLVASGVGDGFAIQSAALTVALGASLGMSLPISTPPNAIAISTGLLESRDMAKVGIAIGTIGYLVLCASAFFFWNLIF